MGHAISCGTPCDNKTDDLLVGTLGLGCQEKGRGDPPAFPEQLETMTERSTTHYPCLLTSQLT